MSYILEALKKSEAQRAQGQPPGPFTLQGPLPTRGRDTRPWRYVAVAVLALSAAVAGGWLARLGHEPQVVTTAAPGGATGAAAADDRPAAAAPHPAAQPAASEEMPTPSPRTWAPGGQAPTPAAGPSPGLAPTPDPVPPTPARVTQATPSPAAPSYPGETAATVPEARLPEATEPAHRALEPVVAASRVPGANPEPPASARPQARRPPESPRAAANPRTSDEPPALTATPPEEPAPGAESRSDPPTPEPPPAPAWPTIQGLAPQVRDALPRIAVSVHGYAADPAARIVRVNGVVLREGDGLDGGLKVETITPQGILFRFRGQVFHLGATEGWRGR